MGMVYIPQETAWQRNQYSIRHREDSPLPIEIRMLMQCIQFAIVDGRWSIVDRTGCRQSHLVMRPAAFALPGRRLSSKIEMDFPYDIFFKTGDPLVRLSKKFLGVRGTGI